MTAKRYYDVRAARPYHPMVQDLERARSLPRSACPRRHCWWWRTLSFDWDVEVKDGCRYLQAEKPETFKDQDVPCSRSDSSSDVDHYESRCPEEDGFPLEYWDKPGGPPLRGAAYLATVLKMSIGRPLTTVHEVAHVFDNKLDDGNPMEIWVAFEGVDGVRIEGNENATAIRSRREYPKPINMGESGESIIRDISSCVPWGAVFGTKLVSAAFAIERESGDRLGVRMTFEGGCKVYVVNWGDELYMRETLPLNYPDDDIEGTWREEPIAP